MKAIQLLVNNSLPEDLRNYTRTMDTASIGTLMAEVARKYPDRYEEIAKSISDLGRKASYLQGETLTLSDMEPVIDRNAIYKQMDMELREAKKTIRDPEEFKQARNVIWSKYGEIIKKETVSSALKRNSNLAYSVVSGARVSPDQLKMMVSTPALYTDSNDDIVPIFIRNSFGDGLRPAEYLAGSYGARRSVLSTKRATAKGGDLCLASGTLVRMADFSLKEIESIKVDEWVLGSDKEGNTFPVKVLATFNQGVRNVFKYEFSGFTTNKFKHSVTCTAEHKFLVHHFDVNYNHKIEISPIGKANTKTKLAFADGGYTDSTLHSDEFALLVGLMLGDGSCGNYAPKSRMHFTCADPKLIEDCEPYVARLNLRFNQSSTNPIQYRISMTSKTFGIPQNELFTHPLKEKLHKLGLIGSKSYTKRIPSECATWDNNSIRKLIQGYTATDGSLTHRKVAGKLYPEIIYSSVSQTLLEGVKDLLQWRFGIYSSEIFRIDKDKKTGFASSCDGFALNIGSDVNVRKALELLQGMPGKKADLVLYYLGVMASTVANASTKKARSAISSKQYIGEVSCYDIEVDSTDHLFVLGNGLVCSNSKQMAQSAVHLLVSTRDCGVKNGIDLDVDDTSLRNRILAKSQGGIPAGTVLDKQSITQLRKHGINRVIARSTITCQASNGVCAKCVGLNAAGQYEDIGSALGVTASGAIGEPITQNALNQKHAGGVATGKKIYSGFDVINRFVQTPEVFPDRAVVAEEDGKVDKITEAPQGGFFVNVNATKHYVPPGYPVSVKVGDTIEAGEPLSEGLISPGDIVRLRGVGEGRKYYADRLKQILDDSGMKADRRNTEMLARAALDHVHIVDAEEDDPYLPDDLVSYNYMARNYTPRADTSASPAKDAIGKYLQSPVLHYTIGTRVTPKIAKHISSLDNAPVYTSKTSPSFEPDMVRLRTAAHSNRDWLASMHTSYLKSQIAESATRGDDTNVRENSHFAPRLAIGEGFGATTKTTGKF